MIVFFFVKELFVFICLNYEMTTTQSNYWVTVIVTTKTVGLLGVTCQDKLRGLSRKYPAIYYGD